MPRHSLHWIANRHDGGKALGPACIGWFFFWQFIGYWDRHKYLRKFTDAQA